MFRRGGFFRFLLGLLLIAFLIGGSVALYQAGFGQGYQAGLVAAGAALGDGATHLPVPAYGYYWPPYAGFGFPFFPFGIFLGIGFFLFVFFVIGGLFRFGGWRRWGGHGGPEGWRYGPGSQWGQPPEPEKKDKSETI
jgi:hypothetical protein